jgi:RNA polymerase-binding protein DksA
MWMTREEISVALGIVPNSVRGKVQKGQIERKIEDGKNLYRLTSEGEAKHGPINPVQPEVVEEEEQEQQVEPVRSVAPEPAAKPEPGPLPAFDPKRVLLDQLASLSVGRNIDAIEKGDEIDLATGEISRELDAKITMRKLRQVKEIQDALDRIKHGEYGQCEDCGETIPEQRLRLFPAARLCVRCQEELDHYEKIKEHQGLRGGAWREDATDSTFTRPFED